MAQDPSLMNETMAAFGLGPTKEEKVAMAADLKTKLLGSRPELTVIDDPYREDPKARYNSLEEFRQHQGEPDLATIRYFDELEAQKLRTNNTIAQAKKADREDGAWAEDAELGSVSGQAKQTGASLVTGSARLGGELSSLPFTGAAAVQLDRVDDRARDIYARDLQYKMGKEALQKRRNQVLADGIRGQLSKDEQKEMLSRLDAANDSLTPLNDEELSYLERVPEYLRGGELVPRTNQTKTYRDLMDGAVSSLDRSKDLNTFFNENEFVSNVLNPRNRDELSEDLSASYSKHKGRFTSAQKAWDDGDGVIALGETAQGIAGLVADGVGDLVSNPAAAFEYVTENVPQLAIGAVGRPMLTASNLGYGAQIYEESLNQYREQNDGKLPSQSEAKTMLAWSLSASVAEQVMDVSILKAIKRKNVTQTPAEVAIEAALKQTAKGGTRRVAEGAGKAIAKTGRAAAGEAVTEGYQTAVEDGFSKLQDPDGEAVFQGAAIGAAAGGGLVAPSAVSQQVGAGVRNDVTKFKVDQAAERTKDQGIADAINAGNYDDLINPENVDQYPQDRVAVALAQDVRREDATPEQKAAGLEALAKMETSLAETVSEYEMVYGGLTPEGKKQIKDRIKAIDRTENPSEQLTEEKTLLEDTLADLDAMPEEEQAARRKTLDELKQALTLASENRQQLTGENYTEGSEQVQVALDVSADRGLRTESARRAITLSMANPDILDNPETVTQLAEDTTLALSEPERTYLRALSSANVARNAAANIESTRGDIFSANPRTGFQSLPQYQSQVTSALQTGNIEAAEKQLTQLREFAKSHKTKARLAAQAMTQVAKGKQINLLADPDAPGGWRLSPSAGKLDDARLRKNGGLSFSTGSQELADNIALESEAIIQTGQQLAAAIELSKNTEAAPEQPEVVSTPESTEAQLTSPEQSSAVEDTPAVAEDVASEPTETETVTEEPVAETTEETEAAETAEAEPVTDDSVLSVFGGPQSDSNLIQRYFRARQAKEGKTARPLTSKKDFLSQVVALAVNSSADTARSLLAPYLGQPVSAEVDQARVNQLSLFHRTVVKWNNITAKSFKTKDSKEFLSEDLVQYLAENGKLDENVLTAISAAAFTWVTENASQSPFNDEDAIKAILGKEQGEDPTTDEINEFRLAGNRDKLVINDLGRRASQALGLVTGNDAPVNLSAKLESSLGSYALNVLMKEGMVERHPKAGTWFVRDAGSQADASHWFVRVKRDHVEAGWKNQDRVEDLVQANKGTKGGLNVLFGVENSLTTVSFEVPDFRQSTTKGTGQGVPSEQREILAKDVKRPWVLRQDMISIGNLPRDLLNRLVGVKSLEDSLVHKARLDSVEGKNDGLIREVDHYLELLQSPELVDDINRPFYFKRRVWRQQRVGIESNTINPLSSKVHRFLMKMPEWTHTVTMTGDSLKGFKLAVLEGFGESTDKQTNQTSLSHFYALATDPVVVSGVDAAMALVNGSELNQVQQDALEAAVAMGGEGLHTLDALVHLGYYQQALNAGESSFTSSLVREGDGINNGPILSLLQAGAWASNEEGIEWANKGGLFETGSPHTYFGSWKEDKANNDLYESLAGTIDEKALAAYSVADPVTRNQYAGVFAILGAFRDTDTGRVTKSGRSRVKTPLTGMIFGASPKKSIANMGRELVEVFYENIESIANKDYPSDQAQEAALTQQLNGINALLGTKVPNNLSVEQALTLELTQQQKNQVVSAFEDSVGTQVQAALDTHYKGFLDFRKQMNEAAKVAFDLYKLSYDYEYRQFMSELDQPGMDLTPAQQKELAERLKSVDPLVHTVMSKESGQLAAGLRMAKITRTLAPAEAQAYSTNVVFKSGFPVTPRGPRDPQGSMRKALRGAGLTETEVDPGVAMFIMMIHAMDSAIISRTYKDVPGLNVHDALITGSDRMEGAMRTMNQQTLNTMVNYSLPEEMMQAVFRVYDGFNARLETMQADPEFAQAYADLQTGGEITDRLAGFLKAADLAESRKLSLAAGLNSVNQYGVENGEYRVTDADRANIAERQKSSVTDRVLKARTRAKMEEPSTVAANLSAWVVSAEEKARATLNKGKTITPAYLEELARLRRISEAYAQSGDLDTVLAREFPAVPGKKGDAARKSRKQWRLRILKELAESQAPVRDIRQAPLNRVLDMLTVAQTSEAVPADLKRSMGNVALTLQTMMTNQTEGQPVASIDYAVRRTLTDTAQAEAVLSYLGRHYNQRQTVWGTLGTPRVAGDPILMAGFEAKPVMKASEVFGLLRESLKTQERDNNWQFQVQMLAQLKGLVSPDLEIQYVTADTPADLAPATDVSVAKGWYTTENGERIQIKGPDFIESDVTVELVLHELIHSVLTGAIEDGKHQEFVNSLESIRAYAEAKVNGDPVLSGKYGNAVSSVHELVAWGLSNQGFQNDVLRKVDVPGKVRGNTVAGKLIKAMQAFLDAITGVLFPGKTTKANQRTGLYQLITTSAGLFEEARRAKAKSDGITLKQQAPDPFAQVQRYTTQEVFDALQGSRDTDPTFNRHLKSVLETVVQELHGPYGAIKAEVQAGAVYTAAEVFTRAKAEGRTPFASEALAHLSLTDQQAYVLEQVEVSVRAVLASDTLAYRDLVKNFQDARNKLAGMKDTAERAKYEFIFNLTAKAGTDRTDHLSRFAAIAIASPEIYAKLNSRPTAPNLSGEKLGDRLTGWFDVATRTLSDKVNGTNPYQGTNVRVTSLVKQLVSIESRRKAALARRKATVLDEIETSGQELGQKAREKLADLANSDRVQNSSNRLLRTSGKVVGAIAEDRVNDLMEALEDYRASVFKGRQGFLASLLNEARGARDDTQMLHDLLRHTGINERDRKRLIENVKSDVLDAFEDGENMTVEEKSALTRVLLRTDLSALLVDLDPEEITSAVVDPRKLDKVIALYEQKVKDLNHDQDYYLTYSKLLGDFMTTGLARGPHLNLNAHNIAYLAGTDRFGSVSDAQAEQAMAVLDPLISLYALRAIPVEEREMVGARMQREGRRDLESGTLYLMKLHEKMKAEALAELFDGEPVHFIKGYTREIYDPHRDVRIATEQESAELAAQGWSKGAQVSKDRLDDTTGVRHIYTLHDSGLQSRLTGVMSFTGTRLKGSRLNNGQGLFNEAGVFVSRQERTSKLVETNLGRVNDRVRRRGLDNDNYMVPVYNRKGEIVDYRYMMSEENKDELLARNNRFDSVMGAMAGSTFDKVATKDQNRATIQALKDHFDAEYAARPGAFITVGPTSSDAASREAYALLPSDTKLAIKEIWGNNDLLVRADVYDMVFGYRKYSLSGMFAKNEVERSIVEKIFTDLLESDFLLGKKAGLRVRQVEDVWQEVVRVIKDAYVIKNLFTLMGNIASNVSVLVWNGVSPQKIVEDHKAAVEGLISYQQDTEELMRLERRQDAGVLTDPAATQQRILELRDAIDRNPVKFLIDEGLFQTIMEDIDAEDDQYSYKSKLVRKVDSATDWVPSKVKSGAKLVYLAHDTKMYKLLFRTTQMSDFVARYTLYNHLVTRARNPLDQDTAIQRIVETFVNYDIPTHRTLQYLNDTGIVFFTKYYIRIQKVLFQLFQEQPARGLMLGLFSSLFDDVPVILESSVVGQVGNPLEAGAFNLPEAVGEIAPIKAAMGML